VITNRILAVFLATAAVGSSALGQIQVLEAFSESRAYTGVKGLGNKQEIFAENTFASATVDFAGPDNSSDCYVFSQSAVRSSEAKVGTLHETHCTFSSPSVSGQQATGFGRTTVVFQADGEYQVGGFAGIYRSRRAPFAFSYKYELWHLETQTMVLSDGIDFFRPTSPVNIPFDVDFEYQTYEFDPFATYVLQSTVTFSAERNLLTYGLVEIGDFGTTPVPEPATLAVLGLGALFLRRRRV